MCFSLIDLQNLKCLVSYYLLASNYLGTTPFKLAWVNQTKDLNGEDLGYLKTRVHLWNVEKKNYEGSPAVQESNNVEKTPNHTNSGSPLPPSFEETARISYELHIKFSSDAIAYHIQSTSSHGNFRGCSCTSRRAVGDPTALVASLHQPV